MEPEFEKHVLEQHEKISRRTSIALSMHSYDRLHACKITLEKIIGSHISFDTVIAILLCVKPLDLMISDYILREEL